ncbi:conserved protein of unknown function [Vibrio tapetis subsp. tapetis]|uniref:Uncharacterized protein n=1 Tax=Vibrio tapetis subsp. tapetis TaxID=1671868 RepID=A0A2N8Z8B3_9VIBR|nr:conserved protein of unknown function [Vibrio tapetis subsp. tapetis]
MSHNKTAAAAGFEPLRSTLVAPGFFDPVVRGSLIFSSRQIKTALEIEPNK